MFKRAEASSCQPPQSSVSSAGPGDVLLHVGDVDCAKTRLARALASESHASFWSASTAQLISPYVGESEVRVRVRRNT